MRIYRLIACVAVMTAFAVSTSAQKNYAKEADDKFEHEAYNLAIDLYKKAYSKTSKASEKARITFMIGECYRFNTEADQAEIYYEKAIQAKYYEMDPIVYLYLADVQKEQGKYADALENYEKYVALAPSDQRGADGVESCTLAQEWVNNPTRYIVTAEILLNTAQYDFSPVFSDKKNESIVFCSSRESATGNAIDDRTGENFQSIFTAERDKKGKWSEPTILGETINTEANEGTACFNKKASEMFFTRCPNEKKMNLGCQIWWAKRQGNDWAEPEMLNLRHEDSVHVSVGHPTLTTDDQVLIFASDMAGGYGGKDLWMTKYDKKTGWGEPTNLGPEINTIGDEMFPYVRSNGDLYFSSNGHVGMGGLDMFVATVKADNEYAWENPSNLQYPLNSEAHDFGIIFDKDEDKGFFTSNRKGGKGKDDIYSFRLPPIIFALECYVYDKDTREPVSNATIQVIGTDNTSYEVTTDDKGIFNFDAIDDNNRYINGEATYEIVVSADSYLVGKDQITTVGLEKSTKFAKEFYIQYTSPEIEITFPEVLYNLDKYDLEHPSNPRDSLEYLYQTLVDNPTIIIELSSHTDSRGSNSYNQKLSERRAKSCVDYLISRGIDPSRMIPVGYGEDRLKISDAEIKKLSTEEEREAAHQVNRRTVFSVLSYDYVPPEGGDGGTE